MNRISVFTCLLIVVVAGCSNKSSDKDMTGETTAMVDSLNLSNDPVNKKFSFIASIKPTFTTAERVSVMNGSISKRETDEIKLYFIPKESNFETGGIKTRIFNNTMGNLLVSGSSFQVLTDSEWVTLKDDENVFVEDIGICIHSNNSLDVFFFIPFIEHFNHSRYRLYVSFVDKERSVSYNVFKEFTLVH